MTGSSEPLGGRRHDSSAPWPQRIGHGAGRLVSLPLKAWRSIGRQIGRRMPKRLYTRSLIIVIAPMLLLQSVVVAVFMERHWDRVTNILSARLASDVVALVRVIEADPAGGFDLAHAIADRDLDLDADLLPAGPLPIAVPEPYFDLLSSALTGQMADRTERPFWIDAVNDADKIEIRVQLADEGVLRLFARRDRAYASNSHIFVVWMVCASLVLITVAILFLRNQVRPIQSLADAAESFGKGRAMPADFRPRGAEEVRRAGLAFIGMRARIERQMEQRTAMLAGVSHDLRTILTRFKLQLALASMETDTDALERDVADMQSMLQAYLDFARGDREEEAHAPVDLRDVFAELKARGDLHGVAVTTALDGQTVITARPIAFRRLIDNIVSNALRYAKTIEIAGVYETGLVTITVDDDGPGIAEDERDAAFRPFTRLEEARNVDAPGTGLGLSIARDIARSHGGEITLGDSPLGGLKVTIRLPG